uniref:IgGFc_binding domain-containing protein n=1 Tax=Rhabditophanes sp. KR3021 TaxID=114890 RepID=A0AC35UEI9_9BILA
MPMSDTFFKGTIGILPVSKQGPITINIFGYVNEKFVLDETDTYETTLGKDQHYIAIYFDKSNGDPLISNTNASITIMSSSPVMLSFESPHSTTSDNGNDGSCGAHCYNDFVQFMPIPSQPIKCGSALKIPDQRMITDDYTTRLHVSAPNSVTNCDSSITVYADVNDINGTKQNVDNMGFTQISLMNTEFSGFSTYDSQLSTNRFGSIFGNDGLDTYGHFMHYVPSTEEWLTGKTQFYTLAKDCVLEIYADNSDSNAVNAIKLDGYPLSALKYYSKNIPFFGSRYTQYVSNMQGYGLHKLESDSNSYVAYVLCQSVNAFFNANGYLVGFNRRKSN